MSKLIGLKSVCSKEHSELKSSGRRRQPCETLSSVIMAATQAAWALGILSKGGENKTNGFPVTAESLMRSDNGFQFPLPSWVLGLFFLSSLISNWMGFTAQLPDLYKSHCISWMYEVTSSSICLLSQSVQTPSSPFLFRKRKCKTIEL